MADLMFGNFLHLLTDSCADNQQTVFYHMLRKNASVFHDFFFFSVFARVLPRGAA